MLVLAIGDLHVPERAIDIPARFKKLLQPTGRIQQVLCLGNATNSPSTLEILKSVSLDFQMVRGEFDDDLNLPLSLIFTYDKLKIGLINGFQIMPKTDPLSLLTQARLMDVDVLIYGSTHKVEAYTLDGKFFVNPGSATGAYSSGRMDNEDMETIENILNERNFAGSAGSLNKTEVNDETTHEKATETEETKTELTDEEIAKEEITPKDEAKEESASEEPKPEERLKEHPEPTAFKETEDKANPASEEEESKISSNGNTSKITEASDSDEDINVEDIEDYIDPIPSFCLLDIQGSVCTLYLYTLIDGEVKVDKLTYRKEDSAATGSGAK